LLILDQKWTKQRFYKIEPFLHTTALTWGISTSIAGVALELFNPSGWSCWIARQPDDCVSSWKKGEAEPNCYRGDNAEYYVWIFFYAPLWIVIASITFCMAKVYWTVLQEEKQNRASIIEEQNESIEGQNEPIEGQNEPKPKKIRDGLPIAPACTLVLFISHGLCPPFLSSLLSVTIKFPPALIFIAALLIPTQGFFNLVIYTLPTFAKFRKQDYLQNQYLVLVWFKMLGVELGLVRVDEDHPKEDIYDDDTMQRNSETVQNNDENIERPGVIKTLSQWMLNPSSSDTTSG